MTRAARQTPLGIVGDLPDGVVLVLGRVDDLIVARIVSPRPPTLPLPSKCGGALFRFEVPVTRATVPLVDAAFWHEVAKRIAEVPAVIAKRAKENG